jgi:N-acetylglucosaminyldiphosphoundecaprenol N-acetyl-beta-D-mannosaminyltransferase
MELESVSSRIKFLKIPIDILEESQLEAKLLELLENGKSNQIVFLGFKDYLKGRNNREFRQMLENCSLVLPSSTIIARGINFLYKKKSSVYIHYDFILKTLSFLEKNNKSMYIIGSNKKNISISEKNLKASYPGLHLVGRSTSYYQRDKEEDIILAIKKSSPSLLLAGSGLKGKNKWISQKKEKFNPGLAIWSPDCFEIFSGKKKRPSRKVSGRFFNRIQFSILRPWRFFYIFPLMVYYLTLIIYKLFKLS